MTDSRARPQPGAFAARDRARVPEVFGEAVERPPAARAAFLDHACAGDPALRAEVESLLEAHAAGAPAFFARPLQVTGSGGAVTELFGGVAPGTRIGPYEIVRPIASGGMGAVYLAERTDGAFEMRVAIKLVHPALWGTDALQRFRLERQVLADLEHPGIARLVDGGSTAGDLPYLVMEYVEGVPINRYVADHGLDVRARLALFLDVCAVVQYAHQNLVIHRDLKPGNVLVDAAGRVKLLDFGIAKVLAPGTGELTVTHVPLTPRYASPEQVLGRRLTTATDVYSLGVVLYELLTGGLPYDLRDASPVTLVRVISSEPPVPPSRRVTDAALGRRLEGDLDTILLKALQKDPARRYASVDDLADDVRRHLDGLTVRARPDTATYRVSRFVARHKALVGGAAAALGVILVALAVTLVALRQATVARRDLEWHAYTASLAATEASIRADQTEEAATHLAAAPERLRGWEWRHLRARLDRSLATFRAHRKRITRIAILPGGTQLVTASFDSTVRVWSRSSGQLVRVYGPFPSEVESMVPVPGSGQLAAGLRDGRVLLLDAAGGTRELQAAGRQYAFVSVSPDGARLACGFFDGSVRVWDMASAVAIADWKAHDGLALPAYSPDGRLLATGGGNGIVNLYDARSLRRLHTFEPHQRRIYRMAFTPDGARLVTGSLDATVGVWDVAKREVVQVFRGHRGRPNAIAFGPDATVVTCGDDGRLVRWNMASGKMLGEFRGHVSDVSAIAADGRGVVTADFDGHVKSWDWTTEDVRTLSITTNWLVTAFYDIVWNADEDLLAGCSNSGILEVWTASGREHAVIPALPTRCAAFLPDSDTVAGGNDAGEIVVSTFTSPSVSRVVARHRGPVLGMDVHPEGGVLATSSADSSARLWRLPGVQPIRSLEGHRGAVEDVEFDPRGTVLATGGADSTIRIWDVATGRAIGVFATPSAVEDLAFDPTGTRLVAACPGHGVRLWDLARRRPAGVFGAGHRSLSVAWSHEGTRIAAGGADGILRLYDVASGREVMSLHGHVSEITALRSCRTDSRLTSASLDGTVRIWDAPVAR